MSHHIGETNKMISETPRTDRVLKNCNGWHHVPIELARELERELNAAQDRIKRLEEAGDVLASWTIPNGNSHADWRRAKDAKL